jgi:crotonobetainyl-CoA:carnitine CoA-transferase CaiB-like acyl-CoA transferase
VRHIGHTEPDQARDANTRASAEPGSLHGMRVADFSGNIPGPLATRLLSQLGAEVWKVERPGSGDVTRDESFFGYLNAGKRSVSLDLRNSEDHRIALDLISISDVVVEGFRPGVMGRHALSYADLVSDHPGLIYCSISGFGQSGPRSGVPAHDINVLALSGFLHRHRDADGELVSSPLPGPVADVAAALLAVVGIQAAVAERNQSGRGRLLDVTLLDAALLLNFEGAAKWGERGFDDPTQPMADCPHYAIYQTSDARGLSLGIVWHENAFWKQFCEAAGLQDLADLDEAARRTNASRIRQRLTEVIGASSLQAWEQRLDPLDLPWAPVRNAKETAAEGESLGKPIPGAARATVPVGIDLPCQHGRGPVLDEHRDELMALLAGRTSPERLA